jgi:6-pyruvoyltetrahydropterin/6-carboxytetrahydropterin synthase
MDCGQVAMQKYSVTRRISIDAAHRVSTHGSKCRNLHGHRYMIEATCVARAGLLHEDGEQTDMVLDFSFLKDEMMRLISEPCDHGLIACLFDIELLRMLAPTEVDFDEWLKPLKQAIDEKGFCWTDRTRLGTAVYIVAFQPTAERLAEHWFMRLEGPVKEISGEYGQLDRVRVWETPNCFADFSNSAV